MKKEKLENLETIIFFMGIVFVLFGALISIDYAVKTLLSEPIGINDEPLMSIWLAAPLVIIGIIFVKTSSKIMLIDKKNYGNFKLILFLIGIILMMFGFTFSFYYFKFFNLDLDGSATSGEEPLIPIWYSLLLIATGTIKIRISREFN